MSPTSQSDPADQSDPASQGDPAFQGHANGQGDANGQDDPNSAGVAGRRRAVCPGSFDPVTNGHLDIIGRAADLYDEVIVAVLVNQSKSSLFSVDERIEMLVEVTAGYPNVVIESFQGLLVDYCKRRDIAVIVKGLRAVSDFDYELQMAQLNRGMAGIETVFMPTNPEYSFLASSLVKDVARWGGDVSALVPPEVLHRLVQRRGER